jgi:hypothetical protein
VLSAWPVLCEHFCPETVQRSVLVPARCCSGAARRGRFKDMLVHNLLVRATRAPG